MSTAVISHKDYENGLIMAHNLNLDNYFGGMIRDIIFSSQKHPLRRTPITDVNEFLREELTVLQVDFPDMVLVTCPVVASFLENNLNVPVHVCANARHRMMVMICELRKTKDSAFPVPLSRSVVAVDQPANVGMVFAE